MDDVIFSKLSRVQSHLVDVRLAAAHVALRDSERENIRQFDRAYLLGLICMFSQSQQPSILYSI